MNAQDLRGVTPLHLALSRLKILGDSGEKKACPSPSPSPSSSFSLSRDTPLIRKKEMIQVGIVHFQGFFFGGELGNFLYPLGNLKLLTITGFYLGRAFTPP